LPREPSLAILPARLEAHLMSKHTDIAKVLVCSIVMGAAAAACGGKAAPAATPDNTSVTTTPPTASSSGTSGDTASTPPSTPSSGDTSGGTTPTPPPPEEKKVDMPASFVTAQTAYFAQADRLGDVVTQSGGDCKKMGAALNKVAADPAFAKSFKDYVSEALKLTPEQRVAAKAAYADNEKKFMGMKDQANACMKDPGLKSGLEKISKIMMSTLQPLLKAFADGAANAK
jgi:hypothetical protein